MSFLKQLWANLAQKKQNQTEQKATQFKEVYPGYRTILIQNLQRKEANQSNHNIDRQDLWKEKQNAHIYTYMQNSKFTNSCDNGFFSSFYHAYMRHGDVKIKPDQVWCVIMLWFTKYVNDNAEQLRTAFVSHQGKKQLQVKTNKDLHDWRPFLEGVIEKIKQNTVSGVVDQLQCNFTSTGLFQRLFSTALVMNTCKKYFDYTRLGAGCGVVNAHMAGTLQDWEKLQSKLCNLEHFDVDGRLKRYIRGLKPVLQQFTQTFKGNANLQFWNNLYFQRKTPNSKEYMPSKHINGWLVKFFTASDEIEDVEQLQSFSVDIKYVDMDTLQVTYFNLNGGCKGYSCVDDYVYSPHYSFVLVQDKQKMKTLKGEKAVQKHKQRMMKKNATNTPIAQKKVVNLQFNKIFLNAELQNNISKKIEIPRRTSLFGKKDNNLVPSKALIMPATRKILNQVLRK